MTFLLVTGVLFKWIKKGFEWFFKFHWIAFIVVLIFSVIHGAGGVLLIGGGIFALDFSTRIYHIYIYRKTSKTC